MHIHYQRLVGWSISDVQPLASSPSGNLYFFYRDIYYATYMHAENFDLILSLSGSNMYMYARIRAYGLNYADYT